MAYTEKLTWILDQFDERGQRILFGKNHQENIDFVHSLNLKCDSVGWCCIDLGRPEADDILSRIDDFCRKNSWRARGIYEREYIGPDSGWYELTGPDICDGSSGGREWVPAEFGGKAELWRIHAYKNRALIPKVCWEFYIVPDRFRRACLKNNLPGIDFCWVEDVGKYHGEQFFQLYADHELSEMGCGSHLNYKAKEECEPGAPYSNAEDTARFHALGGKLPRLCRIFYDLKVELPICYRKDALPEGGFAQAHYSHCTGKPIYYSGGHSSILIHKDTADILMKEKVISESSLKPAMVVDEIPAGYFVAQTARKPKPTQEVITKRLQAYEALKASPKPIKAMTEKEALKYLRTAKKARRDDFEKRMKKELIESLACTDYAPLSPYYAVAASGFLSDEYELLSVEQSKSETLDFIRRTEREELLSEPLCGTVIAKCPDGDRVLLKADRSVIRVSHEAPEETEFWETLAEFIADAITADDEAEE